MARITWTLLLLIIVFFGASFIGIQIYVYQKCINALQVISLPSTTASFEKFNFKIHRSRLILSGISIKNHAHNLKIKELDIQFHPSIFSQDHLLINRVIIKDIVLPSSNSANKVFFEFFKSNFNVSQSTLPMIIEKLIITDVRVPNKNLRTRKTSSNVYIERYKLKSRIAKFNGSMDFLVHVIYFILQNSLVEVQKELGTRVYGNN